MASYLKIAKDLQAKLEEFSIAQVPRMENIRADSLYNLDTSIQKTSALIISVVYLQWPTTWKDKPSEGFVAEVSTQEDWMTPIIP